MVLPGDVLWSQQLRMRKQRLKSNGSHCNGSFLPRGTLHTRARRIRAVVDPLHRVANVLAACAAAGHRR